MSADGGHSNKRLGLLQTTLAPSVYNVLPPNIYNRATFAKNFTVSASWTVDDTELVDEKIPSSIGLLIWLPSRGVDSIARYGITPKDTYSKITSNTAPEEHVNLPFINKALHYKKETPLRYQCNRYSQINISPNPSTDFSVTRITAGVVSVISNTVSTGSIALSGLLSAGIPNDTRDVCQNASGICFDPTDLAQQSITKKDVIINGSVSNGMVGVVGPDIPIQFGIPGRSNQVAYNGERVSIKVPPVTGDSVIHETSPSFPLRCTRQIWVSPWEIELSNIISGSNSTTLDAVTPLSGTYLVNDELANYSPKIDNIYTPNINLYGNLTMYGRVRTPTIAQGSQMAAIIRGSLTKDLWPVVDTNIHIGVMITELWACVLENGSIKYYTTSPVHFEFPFHLSVTPNDFGNTVWGVYHTFDTTGIHNADFKNEGYQYLGTQFISTCRASVLYNVSHGNIHEPGGNSAVGGYNQAIINPDIELEVSANNLYGQGELGPARIFRWDQVSNGQMMKVSGTLVAECVPQGSIAPYITPTSLSSNISLSVDMYPFLNALYNGDSPFKRIWTMDEYEFMIRERISNLNPETLHMIVEGHGGAEKLIGDASGLFSDIGSALGGAFGGDTGRDVGGSVGNIADFGLNILGLASGQFSNGPHSGQASGQFNNVKRVRY